MPICRNTWCKTHFEISADDRNLLQKFDMPDPVYCTDCRHQQRACFQISLHLYERKSALSGKPILTIYRPNTPFRVYANDEWWSDAWDPHASGRPFDFTRPFFDQFAEIDALQPKMATFNEGCENCEYCASAGQSKNCYYCRTVHRSENCYYSEMVTGYNENLCDCLRCQRSQFLYECIQCTGCSGSAWLYRCSDTRDSLFCTDCRGCSNCLLCHNLRNKEYFVRNIKVSKEEFEKEKARIMDGKFSTLQRSLQEFGGVYAKTIWKNLNNVNCENCIGDGLSNSTNCHQCFHCFNAVNCRYCVLMTPSEQCVDAFDITRGGIGELLYCCTGLGGGNYFMRMCCQCRKCSEMTYCTDCFSCTHCFGCSGLKNASYCIFNRQYIKEEYDSLLPRIIAHMQASGEWGKFFPASLSPYPYNDSLGQEYFPLPKEVALARGYRWEDPLPILHHGNRRTDLLPDSIDDIDDEICNEILICASSGREFKLIPQEIAFYRKMRLPAHRHHPDIRMHHRSSMLTPNMLVMRPCMKCGKEMQTTYAPEKPEIVFCESCYLKEVY